MKNERNAGRKPVLNGVRLSAKIPKDKIEEFKEFVKKLQKP